MVPIDRMLSSDFKVLVLHILFPVGTDAECQTYLSNVRKGPTDQITAKVLEAIRAEIRHSYGHPGFIPGKYLPDSIKIGCVPDMQKHIF